jgi:uncharacterized protein YggE
VHDVTRVAGVIDVLVGAGANEIGGIHFAGDAGLKAARRYQEKAVAESRRKAEIYAKVAGVTLGEPLNISEEGASRRSRGPEPFSTCLPARHRPWLHLVKRRCR